MLRPKSLLVSFAAALVLPIAPAHAETLPELPADPEIVMLLDALPPGEAVRLPEFDVIGDGLDAHHNFATLGPGIRDFCNKWVWAEDRGRAMYAGGNAGSPHKFNDLWEYDLESNTWVMLHAPDEGVAPSHTWWGLTYDPVRARVVWMAVTSSGVWDTGGYEGPPIRIYDTQAQNGWALLMTDPPYIRASKGAALEYIPGRDVMLFHSNAWNGAGLQQFDPVTETWTQLISQGDLYHDDVDAPKAEAMITYNGVEDVLVGFFEQSVYVYDFDANAWTRVLERAIAEELRMRDSRSSTDYDPYANLHYVLTDGVLFAYDVATNTMTDLQVEGVPGLGMVYFDREHAVLVIYDETSSHLVYRHAPAPDPGGDESGSGDGTDGGTSDDADASDGGAPQPEDTSSTTDAQDETTSTAEGGTSGASADASEAEQGCGCRSTPHAPWPWLAMLALPAICRRRRGARRPR